MLRNVVAHLRRQDWTAVFIELVVVVVGVAAFAVHDIVQSWIVRRCKHDSKPDRIASAVIPRGEFE